jgi:hypothetical protein
MPSDTAFQSQVARLIGAVALAAPILAFGASTMFPLPKNAVDVHHVVISPEVSEEDYFWVSEKYPASSAIDHYKRVFSKWRSCNGMEKNDWALFGDWSKGEGQFIHQRMLQWVNAADDTAVTVIAKYTSAGHTYRITPDDDRQFVAVLRFRQSNASQMLKEMNVTCEKQAH